MKPSTGIVLISCYELGHQPAGLTGPLAALDAAGFHAEPVDLSVDQLAPDKVSSAWFVGISVPMHTALRLGVRVAEDIRRINPECYICFYGLYALLNADYLLKHVADFVIAGECEDTLAELVTILHLGHEPTAMAIEGVGTRYRAPAPVLRKVAPRAPVRNSLPSLDRYARLIVNGEERLAGYVEASRGCLHMCTHCPISPVYGGRFFVTPAEIVVEDIRSQVAAGARHITFGDPDFLNGPTHSLRIVRAMHEEFPKITFDFTAKIEHIIKHAALFPELANAGCTFMISAVESLSDEVLSRLDKGHTRKDVYEALRIVHDAGISFHPSFVPFTPWTSIDDFIELLEFVESNNLIDEVDPVQYSIRLLVPPGSLLLSSLDADAWVGALRQESFTHDWKHSDPNVDELQRQVSRVVEQAAMEGEDVAVTFYRVFDLAITFGGIFQSVRPRTLLAPDRLRPPRLTESWFCCAEPTRDQLSSLLESPKIQLTRGASRD